MPTDREILFQGFSPEQQRAFLGVGRPAEYGVQTPIWKEGESGSEILLLEEGEVSVWVRGVKVGELGPESVLGVSALVDPHPRTASVVAETEVCGVHVSRAEILAYFESVPTRLCHQLFVNAFHIHLHLIRRCEERIVRLAREASRGR